MVLVFDPPAIPGIGTAGGFEFQVEDMTGRGPAALSDATQTLIAEARKQPEINGQQLYTTFTADTPQYRYDLDRTKAKLLGLNLPDVFNTLQIYLGSLYVNDFNMFGRTFRVTLQAEQNSRAKPSDISRLYVRNSSGRMIPLNTLGSLAQVVGPETVPRYNLYGTAKLNGSVAQGYGSGQAIAAMERVAASTLPADFGFEWTGITYQELKAGSVAVIVFALALVFVFLFLAAQYESWTMPFMVILAVPFALLGALWPAVAARHDDRRILAGRLRHADRPCCEERDPDRRIRPAPARGRKFDHRFRHAGGKASSSTDHHDGLRLHTRRRPIDARAWRGRAEQAVRRHDSVRRHADRDAAQSRFRADLLRGDRAAARTSGVAHAPAGKSDAFERAPGE